MTICLEVNKSEMGRSIVGLTSDETVGRNKLITKYHACEWRSCKLAKPCATDYTVGRTPALTPGANQHPTRAWYEHSKAWLRRALIHPRRDDHPLVFAFSVSRAADDRLCSRHDARGDALGLMLEPGATLTSVAIPPQTKG